MAVINQTITDEYAIYHGDCLEVLPDIPDGSVHFSIYSPPFSDLYNYSSNDRDMSNNVEYKEFLEHYEFLVKQIHRVLMPGRLVSVHCMDLTIRTGIRDFPGDIIRLHERNDLFYHNRHVIWKEPLRVAIRTRSRGLMHKQIVKDSSLCRVALPDYVLTFRKKGQNPIPVSHPLGLSNYVGERPIPPGLKRKYEGHKNPKTNKLSHWIWQQYASAFWDDIRIGRVLPYKPAKDKDDEKHVCPLQRDVIERCLVLWSNPGETILTPFMGVGSEVYTSVECGRKAIGIELKRTYYRQALRNLKSLNGEQVKTRKGFDL